VLGSLALALPSMQPKFLALCLLGLGNLGLQWWSHPLLRQEGCQRLLAVQIMLCRVVL
jgi:hypothetical protein